MMSNVTVFSRFVSTPDALRVRSADEKHPARGSVPPAVARGRPITLDAAYLAKLK
jgi:hypothetical protein